MPLPSGAPSERAASFPKSAYDYGAYKWHFNWTVDVGSRMATHRSGIAFKFASAPGRHLKPPLGGLCPSRAWFGELRGGVDSLPRPFKEHIAVRLCREALQIFSDMASHACQDCPTDTITGDYYMVHNALWAKVHPNGAGMLCLPCLEKRVGRRLQLSDFTDAPVNGRRVAEFCVEAR